MLIWQVLKTEKEQRLLDASKKFDSALASKDLSAWDKVLSEEVVLHKDGITLQGDLHGLKTVKGYFQVNTESMQSIRIVNGFMAD